MDKFQIMLDEVQYQQKPDRTQIQAITARLRQSQPAEVTAQELAEAISRGQTWTGGTFAPSSKFGDRFLGMRLFALDFDNKRGGRQLLPDEAGFIFPNQATERLEDMGIRPLLWHLSFHASADALRFHTIVDFGETIRDRAEAEEACRLLVELFPECDQACSNINRLFFGAHGCDVHMCEAE